MNFHKPTQEANLYVQFVYGPHNIFEHIWVQVSVSTKYYPVNK